MKNLSIEAGVFLMIFLVALGGFASLEVQDSSDEELNYEIDGAGDIGNELTGDASWRKKIKKQVQRTIDVARGKTAPKPAPVAPPPKQTVISPTLTQQKGHVLAISSQPETKIVLDKNDKAYFMTPKAPNGPGPKDYSWRIIDLTVGQHNLTFSKPGYNDFVTNATVKTGDAVIVRANLQQKVSSPTVTLPIVVKPTQSPKVPLVYYDFQAIDFAFSQKNKYLGNTQIAKLEPNVETQLGLNMYAPAVNSPEFLVHFFIDGKKVSEEKLKFYKLAHELPGRIEYLGFSFKPKFTAGTHTLKVILDPDNKIPEADKNNNILEKTIVVK